MKRMKQLAIFLLACSLLIPIFTLSAFSAERPDKRMTLRIGFASRSIQDMPFFVAHERGFFREEGLQAEIVLMKAIQTIQSLLSGSIDFGTATGTAVSAAVNGADVKVVMALTDKPAFDLIAQPNFTSVQQLRGKKIGVSAAGSLTEIVARQILIAHQVPPDQVTILPLGQSHFTYTALKAGVIDAIIASIPITFIAQDDGFRKLASGGDVYRAVHGGLSTTTATITNRPELVTRVIADASRRIKPAQPVTPERVFDFSFAHKVGETLR
jgi:ABC-type nitrate/sulfonate/bicarbonate transport system substrate-binding protein